MSRVLAALVLFAALTLLPVSASGANRPQPALRVAALTPVQVTGLHFKAYERVQVRAASGDTTALRTLRATRAGSFRTTFGAIAITDRCSSDLSVRAAGARGSRASVKLPQLMCPPPLARP
jgi:hypothetical protein